MTLYSSYNRARASFNHINSSKMFGFIFEDSLHCLVLPTVPRTENCLNRQNGLKLKKDGC